MFTACLEPRHEKASSKGSAASAEADEKIRQEKKREEMRQEKAPQMHANAVDSPKVASASSKGSATNSAADEKIRQERALLVQEKKEEMRQETCQCSAHCKRVSDTETDKTKQREKSRDTSSTKRPPTHHAVCYCRAELHINKPQACSNPLRPLKFPVLASSHLLRNGQMAPP
jgi:hypothetical protein